MSMNDNESSPLLAQPEERRILFKNKYNISRLNNTKSKFGGDIYHAILDLPAWLIFVLVLCTYVILVFAFGCAYYALGYYKEIPSVNSYADALNVSIQVQATLGFGSPKDTKWAETWEIAVVLTVHCLATILFNVFLMGTLYARLSSGRNRSVTVKLSKNIVVSNNGGEDALKIRFRLGEIRKHQLLSPTVSCHLFMNRGSGKGFEREVLKLSTRGGGGGQAVLLAVPQEIEHVVDWGSPLAPIRPKSRKWLLTCDRCGESFSSSVQLAAHCQWAAQREDALGVAKEQRHSRAPALAGISAAPNMAELSEHLRSPDFLWELVVIVEGVEPVTSSPVQVRHSYNRSDIVFGAEFAKCTETGQDGSLIVDFSAFDTVIKQNAVAGPLAA